MGVGWGGGEGAIKGVLIVRGVSWLNGAEVLIEKGKS